MKTIKNVNRASLKHRTKRVFLLWLGLMMLPLPLLVHGSGEPLAKTIEDVVVKGPHRGRLLAQDDFQLELAIFETDVPPEYRAWATMAGKAIAPADWTLQVSLSRLGGKVDNFSFSPEDDFLRGAGVVEEPHSFDVTVTASYQGKDYRWQYPSYEGRVELSPEVAAKSGLSSAVAGVGIIQKNVVVYGRVVNDPRQMAHVSARFPGLIRAVHVTLGDQVKQGQVVADVEANESLKRYPLVAPISGTVLERRGNPGEFIADGPLLTLVNYEHAWVELNLFPGDAPLVRVGQAVVIKANGIEQRGRIDFVSHGSGRARVELDNRTLKWPKGLMVMADIVVDEISAPLVIDNRALQSFRDWTVVFIEVGNTYEIRPVRLGRSDGRVSEVLEGLNSGDRYVVGNSYLLKADLEKSGASHDH